MPLIQRAASSSTLFGAAPYQTYAPSQGSITLYHDVQCSSPLSDTATPLIEGQCQNMPISGIRAVTISSLPTCGNYGTPILLVSDQADCENSTAGTGADSGVVGECQAYSTGADIGSLEFICYGSGISAVSTSASSPTTGISAPSTAPGGQGQTNSGGDDDSSGGSCGDCCCTVM